MPKLHDITGKRFAHLIVIKRVSNDGRRVNWLCQCDCGGTKITRSDALQSGATKSCGCYHKEMVRISQTTHGLAKTRIYSIWHGMIGRCYDKSNASYIRYGAKGIIVCDRWFKIENFIEDMGLPPSKLHTLDRIKNTLGYHKLNCRWVTPKEQANNRTNNLVQND